MPSILRLLVLAVLTALIAAAEADVTRVREEDGSITVTRREQLDGAQRVTILRLSPQGWLQEKITPAGVRKQYTVDGQGRIVACVWMEADTTRQIRCDYDSDGMIRYQDQDGGDIDVRGKGATWVDGELVIPDPDAPVS